MSMRYSLKMVIDSLVLIFIYIYLNKIQEQDNGRAMWVNSVSCK